VEIDKIRGNRYFVQFIIWENYVLCVCVCVCFFFNLRDIEAKSLCSRFLLYGSIFCSRLKTWTAGQLIKKVLHFMKIGYLLSCAVENSTGQYSKTSESSLHFCIQFL